MKSGILVVFCRVGCQCPPSISSETQGPNAPALVVLNPMPKTGKEGPISKPKKYGMSIQAVEAGNRNFLTLRLINTGSKPIVAYNFDSKLVIDCEITSVPGGIWRKEPEMQIHTSFNIPTKDVFTSIPGHGSISLEVRSMPIPEKVRAGTYIATVD